MSLPDVDLDVGDRDAVLNLFPRGIGASLLASDKTRLIKHETGMYLQNIPSDPDTRLAVFPYKDAEERGFMKMDILYNRVYADLIPVELDALMEMETDWDWYLDPRFYIEDVTTSSLVHLGGYYKVVKRHPPKSVGDLAVLIAMIRPAKKHLVGKPWETILSEIWTKTDEGFAFKKSHSLAYGLLVSLHAKVIALELS